MAGLYLTTIALFTLTAATCLRGAAMASPITPLTEAQIKSTVESLGPTHSSRLVRNTAECAPDLADAVWGPHNEFLGYSCYSNDNGG